MDWREFKAPVDDRKLCTDCGNFEGKTWNGKCNAAGCNGKLLPEGVYFIVFDYRDGLHKQVNANIYLKQ